MLITQSTFNQVPSDTAREGGIGLLVPWAVVDPEEKVHETPSRRDARDKVQLRQTTWAGAEDVWRV